MVMNYEEALRYVLGFADLERSPGFGYALRFDLSRVRKLLKLLGDPQDPARSVHIAGTKGKGSTAAMIASGLRVAGFRTGLYISPHLHTIRERMRIGEELISEREFASLIEEMKPKIEEVHAEGELTTFEILTALAFLFFAKNGVQFQVIEVGLGGRLDATNVILPEVSVITSISFDHTEVLGETLSRIAAEKAGIVKRGVPVVVAPQAPEALAVIEEIAREKGSKLVKVGEEIVWEERGFSLEGQRARFRGLREEYDIFLPLLGAFQLENAACAIAALELLEVDKGAIEEGLRRISWPGRMEILRRNPLLLADGAHNLDSIRRLLAALRKYFPDYRKIFVVGFSGDKKVGEMLREIGREAALLILTKSRHPRAAPLHLLERALEEEEVKGDFLAAEGVDLALKEALSRAGERDLICVTGSLFVVAEAREHILGIRPDPKEGG